MSDFFLFMVIGGSAWYLGSWTAKMEERDHWCNKYKKRSAYNECLKKPDWDKKLK